MASDEFVPAIGDEIFYDRWQNGADVVLLPSTNRTAYLRAGLVLLQEKAFDIRNQMAADANAARWRGTAADAELPTGPTAAWPAAS